MGLSIQHLQCLCLFLLLHFQVASLSSFNSFSEHLCPYDQSLALLQFKNTFSIKRFDSAFCDVYPGVTSYLKTISWKEGTDCCSWKGVTCDRVTGHVVGLNLSCSWLHGSISIHSNSTLFLLSHLESLDLSFNDFMYSRISPMFGRFKNLTHLSLSGTQLSGTIPPEISHLSKLVVLDLSFNDVRFEMIDFKVLAENLTKLRELVLDDIDMSSVVPDTLLNLSSLTSLSLGFCGLQGKLPENIFHLPNLRSLSLPANDNLIGYLPNFNSSSLLNELDLSVTSFSREIPNSIQNLKSLTILSLSACKFSGSIPSSLGNLTQLTHLSLSSNHFNGEVPSSLSNLEQLVYITLSENNFEGHLPNIFDKLTKLVDLQLDRNNFNGQFPSFGSNLTKIYSLDLSNNQLTGPIPSHMIELSNLSILKLGRNFFSGELPSWLFTLPSLLSLDLSANQLTGHIDEFQYKSLIDIDLSNNKLQGSIPSSVYELVNLTHLSLASNNLSGTVKLDKFSRLEHLYYLDLSHNSFSLSTINSVNSTFPMITGLEYVDLSNNKIDGLIPKWLMGLGNGTMKWLNLSHNSFKGFDRSGEVLTLTSPDILDLQSNMLEGSLPVPSPSTLFFSIANNKFSGILSPSICNLSSLQFLDLSNNNLHGSIPPCLANSSIDLSVLNLQRNGFQGFIPPTYANGSRLRSLDVSYNKLEGLLPRSLANCTNLEVLNLENNMVADTFPHWLATLPDLQVLVLRSNRFHGSMGQLHSGLAFAKLSIIDISHNNFTGDLPSKFFEGWLSMATVDRNKSQSKYMGETYFYYHDSVTIMNKGVDMVMVKILTLFKAIDFSNNELEGEIPESVGMLKSLIVLNFSNNRLTGHIPSSLGNLAELESLDLSRNELSGKIPQQLTSLTFLEVFDVSHNHLVGPIPRGAQFETFSSTSYKDNSGLCGFPLSSKCGKLDGAHSPPSTTQQSHNYKSKMDGFDWKVVLMGYGCGLVIGVVGGYFILTRKEELFIKVFNVGHHQKSKRMSRARGR